MSAAKAHHKAGAATRKRPAPRSTEDKSMPSTTLKGSVDAGEAIREQLAKDA